MFDFFQYKTCLFTCTACQFSKTEQERDGLRGGQYLWNQFCDRYFATANGDVPCADRPTALKQRLQNSLLCLIPSHLGIPSRDWV